MKDAYHWIEIHPNKFQRQIGNQVETREIYFAPHCKELNIFTPVEVNEFSIVSHSQSAFVYSISSVDKSQVGSHTSKIPIYQEYHKLTTLEILHLHNLLFS